MNEINKSNYPDDSIRDEYEPIRTCPVCGSNSMMLMYSISSTAAARTFAAGPRESKKFELQRSIEQIWGQKYCNFFLCHRCSYCFADPFVAATPEFYSLLYSTSTAYPESKWEFERTLSAISALINRGKLDKFAIIDIGAGAGGFISKASISFPGRSTILCTEYSKSGIDIIRSRGLSCLHGGLMDIDKDEYAHRFDILCLFQVLEHMDNVDAAFSQLSALATDSAHMFIAVPNHKMRAYFDAIGFHEDLPPVHVGRWNIRCLEMVAERHGWKIEEDETQPECFTSKLRHFAGLLYSANPVVMRLRKTRHGCVRRPLIAGLLGLLLLRYFRSVLGLLSKELGTAYWVHLSR